MVSICILLVCVGCQGQVVMASGMKSEGSGFEPRHLQVTFDTGLAKNNKQCPAIKSVPFMKKFTRRT